MTSVVTPFGTVPDCAPVVEGEVVPVSKQRLVRLPDQHVIISISTRQKAATCLQEDGGWLTVYKFRKYVHGVGLVERLRHFAMWKTEQGGCRYKVYET